jgi:thiol-disulfide isomerase/thioredoxin
MKNYKQFTFIHFFLLLIVTLSCNTIHAIDFDFVDIEGQSHQLSDYKGQWVLANFWATWCPPCRRELPDLSDFHTENDNVVVIGINYEPEISNQRLKEFVDLYLISYPMTRVNDNIIDVLGEPRGLPTSILINAQGDVVKKISGSVTLRRLNKIIAK